MVEYILSRPSLNFNKPLNLEISPLRVENFKFKFL